MKELNIPPKSDSTHSHSNSNSFMSPPFPRLNNKPDEVETKKIFEMQSNILSYQLALETLKEKVDPENQYERQLQPLYDLAIDTAPTIQRKALNILMKKDLLGLLTNGVSVLQMTIMSGDLEIFKILLENSQVDVNSKTFDYGRAALHFAVACDQHEFLLALLSHSKLDINTTTKHGSTGMHLAVEKNSIEYVHLLLAFKPDLTLKKNGETALDLAIKKNNAAIYWALIGSDAAMDPEKCRPKVEKEDEAGSNDILECVRMYKTLVCSS